MRRGLTLIELLIVITIIAILAGLVLGAASIAGEAARESHSRHMVTRLAPILNQIMATYKTRRVELRKDTSNPNDPGIETQIARHFQGNQRVGHYTGEAKAEARMYALRELMLMEVPDRWSDIVLGPVGGAVGEPFYNEMSLVNFGAIGKHQRSEYSAMYLRQYAKMVAAGVDANIIINNQGAECLYMIVTIRGADGEARSQFHESSIGDVDGDGAREFLDGWGHPINFLRWAPGFDSEIQSNFTAISAKPSASEQQLALRYASDFDHDPFDVYRVDMDAFRLAPLVYSPGRDEDSGLVSREDYRPWPLNASRSMTFANSPPLIVSPKLSPYKEVETKLWLGMDAGDRASTDNVHNHLLGEK